MTYGGSQVFQDAAFFVRPGFWQFDNVVNSQGSLANGLQQRHDGLQPMSSGEDSPIEPLSAGVETFGQGDLLAVSQQGNPANFDEVTLK